MIKEVNSILQPEAPKREPFKKPVLAKCPRQMVPVSELLPKTHELLQAMQDAIDAKDHELLGELLFDCEAEDGVAE